VGTAIALVIITLTGWYLIGDRPLSESAPVGPNQATRVAIGDRVTVSLPAGAVDSPGTITIRVVDNPKTPLGLRLSTAFELVLTEGSHLTGAASVSIGAETARDDAAHWLAQPLDEARWSAQPVRADWERRRFDAELRQLGLFAIGQLDTQGLAANAASVFHGGDQTSQPECPDSDQLDKQGIKVDTKTEAVKWCAGFASGKLIVRLTGARPYPIMVRYEDTAGFQGGRGSAPVTWFTDRTAPLMGESTTGPRRGRSCRTSCRS
jgi:hypothetical protein